MHINFFNPKASKKSTNLSINSELLQQAKQSKINLSKTLEQRLIEILLDEKRRQWKKDNHEAIEAFNRRIETSGVFSDKLRNF